MNSKEIKVAIVLATYNGEKYIGEQLHSIKMQTHTNYTCYIHDDGSTDGTLRIIEQYAAMDDRFNLLTYSLHGGAKGNFLSMLQFIKEDYMFFCDQDDIWSNIKIEAMLDYILRLESANNAIPILAFHDLTLVDENLRIIASSFMNYSHYNTDNLSYRRLLLSNIAPGCSMIMNRKLLHRIQHYRHVENIDMHDWWAIGVASVTGIVAFNPKRLTLYRQHSTQTVGAKSGSGINRIRSAIKQIRSGDLVSSRAARAETIRRLVEEVLSTQNLQGAIQCELYDFIEMFSKPFYKRLTLFFKYGWGNPTQRLWYALWMCSRKANGHEI